MSGFGTIHVCVNCRDKFCSNDASRSRMNRVQLLSSKSNPFLFTIFSSCLAVTLSSTVCAWAADETPTGTQHKQVKNWEKNSLEYPFGDELHLLAIDAVAPEYEVLLDKMIRTDLDAEWQRVATVDNYQTFAEQYGGIDTVRENPKLTLAYDARREIAMTFINRVRKAYEKHKREPPFNEKKVDELCAKSGQKQSKQAADATIPIRAMMVNPLAEHEWPQFRGPTAQGIVVDTVFPLEWGPDKNIHWKTKLPGPGNSSPAIWGDKLFVTAASSDGSARWLLCYSTESGEKLWQHEAPPAIENVEKLYPKNTYASGSPVTDGENVVAFFGNSGLVCCDVAGKEIWKYSLGAFPTMHGPGTSPILYDDMAIFMQDQNAGESVFLAINKRTGELIWKQTRPLSMCWSTPLIAHVGQRDELLYNGSNYFASYDPRTGNELWRITGASRESIPMPVIGGGMIVSVSGRNGPMLAFRPGANGDATETHTVWSIPRGGPHVPTPVYVDRRLFLVNDMGIASCRNAETGELVWQERLTGKFSMSMLSAGDKLLVTSESGTTHILRASDKYESLAVNELDERTLATPAIVRGRIYFRTAEHLICIGDRTSSRSATGSN